MQRVRRIIYVFDKAIRRGSHYLLVTLVLSIFVVGCGPLGDGREISGEKGQERALRVVATTTFVGDVVREVGGEQVELTVMLAPGANPHAYQPAPRDVAGVSEADVIFANGLGLETFLDDLIANAGGDAKVVRVSEGIEVRTFSGHDGGEPSTGEDVEHEEGADNPDPHVWFDPLNLLVWTENIEGILVEMDPDHADVYHRRAAAYREEIRELDQWIQDQVAKIPPENRKLVTDHTVFGYFAERYGFKQIGAVIPAPTTEAQPSGKQLAQLQALIREENVQAIFVGRDFDPSLAARMAEDTGVKLVPLYFGSLTPPEGPAATYIQFMKTNVRAIVKALGSE